MKERSVFVCQHMLKYLYIKCKIIEFSFETVKDRAMPNHLPKMSFDIYDISNDCGCTDKR